MPKARWRTIRFVLHGYVRHWLGQVWDEFDRVKLLNLTGFGKERAQAAHSYDQTASAPVVSRQFR